MNYTNIEKPSKEYLQRLISQKKLVKIVVRTIRKSMITGIITHHYDKQSHYKKREGLCWVNTLRCLVGIDGDGSKAIVTIDVDDISRIKEIDNTTAIIWKLEHNM